MSDKLLACLRTMAKISDARNEDGQKYVIERAIQEIEELRAERKILTSEVEAFITETRSRTTFELIRADDFKRVKDQRDAAIACAEELHLNGGPYSSTSNIGAFKNARAVLRDLQKQVNQEH